MDPFSTVYGQEWFTDTDAGLVFTDKGVFPVEAVVGDLSSTAQGRIAFRSTSVGTVNHVVSGQGRMIVVGKGVGSIAGVDDIIGWGMPAPVS